MNRAIDAHYLDVLGAKIYYEVRGSGPLLALIAAPMGSAGFVALADLLASQYTVVTYDPRGSEHSTVTDRTEITTPELLADDVHRVLNSVSDEPAAILGSSGGAVTGLALVTAHPEQVSVLVAHEPPLLTLLSNAEEELAVVQEIYQTYLRAGSDPQCADSCCPLAYSVKRARDSLPLALNPKRYQRHQFRRATMTSSMPTSSVPRLAIALICRHYRKRQPGSSLVLARRRPVSWQIGAAWRSPNISAYRPPSFRATTADSLVKRRLLPRGFARC